MPRWDEERSRESAIWRACYLFGWGALAVFGVLFGAMCAAGLFYMTGER